MNKIVILCVYFGKFPDNINLWLKSCSYNKKIDFKIFSDQKLPNSPDNVQLIKMTLPEFSSLASKKLGIDNICINTPYKCCDFKMVYGIILEDYIKEYAFWGHCDLDLIFGDILGIIPKDAWEEYDKILPLGHLSFYRNTDKVNNRYMADGSEVGSYMDVFTKDRSFAFDEFKGIMKIYEYNNFPFYKERLFADISVIYKRFKLALKDKNYKNQVFYWDNGRAYRAYIDPKDEKIKTDEFAYIHFKRRKNLKIHIKDIKKCHSFYITQDGFINKLPGTPNLDNIKKYNPYKGLLCEKIELINYSFKTYIRAIKEKIANG